MISSLHIREVGPRDGLQVEGPVPVDGRVRLVELLATTGIREIEAVSFVSPTAVPSMAEPGAVMASLARDAAVR